MKSKAKFLDIVDFFKQDRCDQPGDRGYDSRLCSLLMNAASSKAASIWLLDEKGRLRLKYGTHVKSSDACGFLLEVGEGISGAVALSQETISVHQVESDPSHSRRMDSILGFHIHSMVSAPIMGRGRLYGVINILNYKSGRPFPAHWKVLLSTVGMLYAYSMQAYCPRCRERVRNAGIRQTPKETRLQKTAVVGINSGIRNALSMAMKAAQSEVPALIHGETGTGKELIARRIHEAGISRDRPFVAVNCAAVSETLMESELFGHVRGAFSGAVSHRKGKFAAAAGGTLFLDEIGDMSPACQAKILRAIQEKCITPLGSEKEVACRVRIVAATNKDLNFLVGRGTFRDDLYYRLCGIEILLPPLRQRTEDIALLATYFLKKGGGARIKRFSDRALDMLVSFSWPGNVRQLEQAVLAADAVCSTDEIGPNHFPPWLHNAMKEGAPCRSPVRSPGSMDRRAGDAENRAERSRYLGALKLTSYPATGRWNISAAARHLNMPRKTLVYRMRKLNINPSGIHP